MICSEELGWFEVIFDEFGVFQVDCVYLYLLEFICFFENFMYKVVNIYYYFMVLVLLVVVEGFYFDWVFCIDVLEFGVNFFNKFLGWVDLY